MGKVKQLHSNCEDGECKVPELKCDGYGGALPDDHIKFGELEFEPSFKKRLKNLKKD